MDDTRKTVGQGFDVPIRYPVFAVMIGTGLRVGEVTGLRWCDIDMESGMIDVNHTLVYYDHRTEGSKKGCYFNVNTTKTPASMRQVPMLDFVKEASDNPGSMFYAGCATSFSREGVERVYRRTVRLWPNRWKPSTKSICWNGVVP